MPKKSIKNIVFDFGGVLLDIDYQRTYDAFKELMNVELNPKTLSKEILQGFHDFETGDLNIETFIWNIQRMAPKNTPQGQDVIRAWNAMLIGWKPEKFDFLLALRKKYNIYLLSNTNELHIEWVHQDLIKRHNISDFETRFFDHVFYSHLIGMRKPNANIYQYVTDNQILAPSETLFVDDLLENIQTAHSLGWKTYHHNPKEDILEVFREKNIW